MRQLWIFAGCGVLGLSACTAPPVIALPTTAKPYPVPVVRQNNGSIFQASTAVMLFEEPLPRRVGDILTVEIAETLSATGKNNSNISRKGTISNEGEADETAPGLIRALMNRNNYSGTSDNQFKGAGSYENNNSLTAKLPVTVIDVLSNGNLMIGGEKRIALNGEENTLRLTGILNRKDIKTGNVISSQKIADARLELVGKGVVKDANTMGWLQKIFMSLSPY
jgi:flagellar L-ring protein precursor FlgH